MSEHALGSMLFSANVSESSHVRLVSLLAKRNTAKAIFFIFCLTTADESMIVTAFAEVWELQRAM